MTGYSFQCIVGGWFFVVGWSRGTANGVVLLIIVVQLDAIVGTTCRLVATTAKDDPDDENRENECNGFLSAAGTKSPLNEDPYL